MIVISPPDPTKHLFSLDFRDENAPTMRGVGKTSNLTLSCGLPIAINLFEQYADWGKKVPLEIRSQADQFDFWLIQMVFTLETRRGYETDWMEIGINLSHPPMIPYSAVFASNRVVKGEVPGYREGETPIAYDLHPISIQDKVDVEDKLTLAPSLEFEKVKFSPGEASLTIKHTEPLPRVTAFRKREQNPYWKFEAGTSPCVEPGIKELKMLVRSARGLPTRAEVKVKGKGGGFFFSEDVSEPVNNKFYF